MLQIRGQGREARHPGRDLEVARPEHELGAGVCWCQPATLEQPCSLHSTVKDDPLCDRCVVWVKHSDPNMAGA